MMTFAEWWKSVEGWRTEGGSGESKARAAWDHQQKQIVSLCRGILYLTSTPMGSAYEMPRLQSEARAILGKLGLTCETCGGCDINQNGCLRCGAPICCEDCCKKTADDVWKHQHPPTTYKCPHCGLELTADHALPLVVMHDYPPMTWKECPGVGQKPRNAATDNRPLWKDDAKQKEVEGT